jgi:two-component system, LytTR family, response regulator
MQNIAISTPTHYLFIKQEHIIYLEASSNYTNIYTSLNKSSIVTSKSLIHFEALLSNDSGFIRIHDKYIINAAYINSIEKGKTWLVQLNNIELPVSASKKDALKRLLHL